MSKSQNASESGDDTTVTEKFPQTVGLAEVRPLRSHISNWSACRRCDIGHTCDKHVFWRGTIPAEVLFIGTAPDHNDNALGKPLIGPAGHFFQLLLDEITDEIPDFTYCITHLICCLPANPPNSLRSPLESEILKCSFRLEEFIKIVQPRGLIAIGDFPQAYLPDIRKLRKTTIYSPSYMHSKHPSEQAILAARTQIDIKAFINQIRRAK